MKFITELKPNEIFVFGSNLAGRHGAGAAKWAAERFGAIEGIGFGRQGKSYAIPTKDAKLRILPLSKIDWYVREFLFNTEARRLLSGDPADKDLKYLVTPIGCGLAGYTPQQIAPLFAHAEENIILPPEFLKVLRRT